MNLPALDNTDQLDAAVIIILLFTLVGVLIALVFIPIPKDNVELFSALASGVIGSGVSGYLGYRFGSSRASQAQQAVIASQLPPKQ